MGKIKKHAIQYVFIILSITSLLFVGVKGPLLYNDSNAYFGMWPYVSAGYPFFLRSLHVVFGDMYPMAAVTLQYIAVIVSIYVFVTKFLTLFKLQTYQYILILLLLFYPVFDSNVYMITNISTEGLCFALFLQVIHLSYRVLFLHDVKLLLLLWLFMIVLVSIRGQFQFLVPVFIAIELVRFFMTKKWSFKHLIVLFTIPLAVFVVDNVYHKLIQKQYFSTPFVWTAFVTSILFVADDADVEFLDTENQKEVFKLVKAKFKEKGVDNKSHKYYEEPIDYNYFFYHYELPTLCNQTVQQDVLNYYLEGQPRDTEHIVAAYLKLERTHKELFFQLFPHVFQKWSALTFQNFKTGIGGVSIAIAYIFALVILLMYYAKTHQTLLLWMSCLLVVLLLNRVVVSVSVHGLTRYFFYTDWITVFLLFLGVNMYRQKLNASEQ
ncbi:MAG: hypothetical protein ACPGU9_03600 [Flavobacteriaceae bacterium]